MDRDRGKAERLLVLIDNDPVLSERLTAVLANYHFRVQVIPDGNDLLMGPQLHPVLIVLCIDPKRLGWAICNKIKKTVQYRDVPMIVTSQEATDKDFEDHKKLRTRAEEYLHKPYSVELLLAKIDTLVGLDLQAAEPAIETIDDAAIEEISVDDAVIEEELPAAVLAARAPLRQEKPAPMVDADIELETDAAFAAIGADESSKKTPIPHGGPTPPRSSDSGRSGRFGLPGMSVGPAAEPSPAPAPAREKEPERAKEPEGVRAPERERLPEPSRSGYLDDDLPTVMLPSRSAEATTGPRPQPESPTVPAGSESRALAQLLETAQTRLADAESKATYWHDQRDQLASERDFLFHERERLALERAEWIAQRDRATSQHEQLLAERKSLFSERDQLVAERNQLAVEKNQLAAERDTLAESAQHGPGDGALATAQARFAEEKARLVAERDQLLVNFDRMAGESAGLTAEHQRLQADRDRLAHELAQLGERLSRSGPRAEGGRAAGLLHQPVRRA